jgi:hypothetical protein
MFLQLWPVIQGVTRQMTVSLRAMAGRKIKLEEEAISEILVADIDLESGVQASDV